MPSLSSPPSHPSRIAEAGETSKTKKKAATFNSIPSISACVPAAAPEPTASGEPRLPAAAGYFGGFVPRRDWNRLGCCQDQQAGTSSVAFWRLDSPVAALQDTELPSQLNDTLHNSGHR